MNYKRGKPKSSRSGCLMCKPWKRQGSCLHQRDRFSDFRRGQVAKEKIRRFRCIGEE